jgi:glycosyltransferase involved in cell wall biosynthesis
MEKEHLIQIGVSPERITVIPNGITLPPLKVPNADFSPMILCLARLDINHKGQDILLHAMQKVLSKLPKTKLFIVGDGDDFEKLNLLTKKLNIEEKVEFKGPAFSPQKNVYLKNCDVLCISPRTESYGVVYLEAMAYGRPIVTTNVGGIPEVVGDCAILVPPNDPESLAEALIEVLTNNKLSKNLGEKGLQRVQGFNYDHIVPKYESLYESLMKK